MSEGERRWFIALAALALVMQVLIPQGFMVGHSAAGPELVICTGHGPLVVATKHPPAKAPNSRADAPCALSAHGAAAPPPQPAGAIAVAFAPARQPAIVAFDLTPGRGLATPPPPSRGPPAAPI